MRFFKFIFILSLSLQVLSVPAAEQTENEKLIAVQKVNILDKNLLMIGMGLTRQMNGDYYIGAFYLDEGIQYTGSDEFFLFESTRRMEFRIAAETSISARSFSRKLAESIRINNGRKELREQKKLLTRLIKSFKGTYKKGDIIRFDYHPDFGTRAFYNGRMLIELPISRDMYNMLVRVWIGLRPPSSQFKKGIMGENEGDFAISLLKRFMSL